MAHPKFPLPSEHLFSPRRHERCHDGSHHSEGMALLMAQRALKARWGLSALFTGRMDASTQAAIAAVQSKIGVNATGEMDHTTWDAVFTADPHS